MRKFKVTLVRDGDVFDPYYELADGHNVAVCGERLQEYFDFPADAAKIDIVISSRPSKNAYEARLDQNGDIILFGRDGQSYCEFILHHTSEYFQEKGVVVGATFYVSVKV